MLSYTQFFLTSVVEVDTWVEIVFQEVVSDLKPAQNNEGVDYDVVPSERKGAQNNL